MSRFATKWQEITVEEYRELMPDERRVYSGYTNPDGDDGFRWHPEILTTWGDDKKEMLKSVQKKFGDEKWKWKREVWQCTYFKAVEWEQEDNGDKGGEDE